MKQIIKNTHLKAIKNGCILLNEVRNIEKNNIIEINFNNFHMFDERPIIKFQMMDKERHLIENENYERYNVNLALIRKKYYNKEELSKEEKEVIINMLKENIDINIISRVTNINKEYILNIKADI